MRISNSSGSSGNTSDFEELPSPSLSTDDMPDNNITIQKFRSSAGEPLASITAETDKDTGEAYIPWQHIENLFHNIQCVRADGVNVEFMVDADSKIIQPPRIRHFPDVTLEVHASKNAEGQQLIEAYNDVLVSCSEAQKETRSFLAENIKGLAAGLGSIALNEFTKDHRQREQATAK
ncbi:hypothetical protein BGZ65_012497, partial [Modicella reniformis]